MSEKRTGESLTDMFKQEIKNKTTKRPSTKELKQQSAKTSKRQDVKVSKGKRKHTIYLSPEQSKKLRVYAAENDKNFSEIVEELINKKL